MRVMNMLSGTHIRMAVITMDYKNYIISISMMADNICVFTDGDAEPLFSTTDVSVVGIMKAKNFIDVCGD